MPNIKSAEKRVRASAKKEERNKSVRSSLKTHIGKAEDLIESGNTEEAAKAVDTAVKVLDKSASKGVIKPSNAARRKSRLVKKLNKAQA